MVVLKSGRFLSRLMAVVTLNSSVSTGGLWKKVMLIS